VYVIAGPNGAGKTTFATKFLPDFVKCREFLNADLIATGLSPFAPESQNVRAGRLLLTRISELTAAQENFGFETTLAGRSYAHQFRRMKLQGYQIVLFFLWLPSADLSVARVAGRVRKGGHNVPEEDVRRRFAAGLRNFFGLYRPLVEMWSLYDASRLPPRLVASEQSGKLDVVEMALYNLIKANAEKQSDG
jgi:predicted ABC-type ATPase